MKDNSLLKLGSVCAILLAMAKIVSAVTYLVLPAELRAEVPGKIFLPAFAKNPNPLLVFFWAEAAVGLLGIAIVPAIASLVRQKNEGWVTWSSNLAMLGYGVSTIGYMLSIARLPGIAAAYVAGDASTQAALAAVWKASIDLFGFWGYATIGFWILVISVLALRHQLWQPLVAWMGVLLVIPHWAVPVGTIFKAQPVLMFIAIVGGILAPIWYLAMGIVARRAASKL